MVFWELDYRILLCRFLPRNRRFLVYVCLEKERITIRSPRAEFPYNEARISQARGLVNIHMLLWRPSFEKDDFQAHMKALVQLFSSIYIVIKS